MRGKDKEWRWLVATTVGVEAGKQKSRKNVETSVNLDIRKKKRTINTHGCWRHGGRCQSQCHLAEGTDRGASKRHSPVTNMLSINGWI